MANCNESAMDALVKLSNHFGADPALVLAGGGNTSLKLNGSLHVKASGTALATIDAGGFVAMDTAQLVALLTAPVDSDPVKREEQFKKAIYAARLEPAKDQRPSVECVLHAMLPSKLVVHVHPTLVNMLTCCKNAEKLFGELFGKGQEAMWLPYTDPGWILSRTLYDALTEYTRRTGRKSPDIILMGNHGLVICGETPEEIHRRTEAVLAAISSRLGATDGEDVFGEVSRVSPQRSRELVNTIAPALRGLLAEGESLKIVTFEDSNVVMTLAGASRGQAVAMGGPLIPDHIVYCTSYPLWLEPREGEKPEQLIERLRQAIQKHIAERRLPPKVVLVAGVGMFAVADDFVSAETVRQNYRDAIQVLAGAQRLGGIAPLSEAHRRFIEDWEVESYRRKVAQSSMARGKAAGKIALVTGAAQGYGLEIARDLAEQGGLVVLADLNAEGVRKASAELNAKLGAGRTLGVEMNVTDGASIAAAVHQAVRTYGGLDIVISNAGVLKAESVKTQPVKDFDFVTAVNYKGYFLVVQNVANILAAQHAARPGYMSDIIQINSKSGLEGSNKNFAYAGGKFGGIGLTQSFAMELIADGVKVNSICPGNFLDGLLWSDPQKGLFVQYLRAGKVPGAKTVADVRKAYEDKVPMKRGCTTADVMKAIYYLVDQKYETGQALPVTGGQVMLK